MSSTIAERRDVRPTTRASRYRGTAVSGVSSADRYYSPPAREFTHTDTGLPALLQFWRQEPSPEEPSKLIPLVQELQRMHELADDWDSNGAAAPAAALIDEAADWLRHMPSIDPAASLPDAVAPGVNGEVVFYWQRVGQILEAVIAGPHRVEWMEASGDRVQHFQSDTDVVVVNED